jgi:hypothetical protein
VAKGLAIEQHCGPLGRLISSDAMRAHSTAAPSSRRRRPQRYRCSGRAADRFGRFLAAVALLLLQIALSNSQTPPLLRSGNGAPDLEHALCLSTHNGTTEAPANQTPNTDHHIHAACCFWHGSAGLVPVPAATSEPIAFAGSVVAFARPKQIFPRRPTGSVGARAPPVRA